MAGFNSTAKKTGDFTPKPTLFNRHPVKESQPNSFAIAINQMPVGEYIGVCLFGYWDKKLDVAVYGDPVIVKVVEKHDFIGTSVKVQMANGKVLDLFGKSRYRNEYGYPKLNEEFIKIVRYERVPDYSSPDDVNVWKNPRSLSDYSLIYYETNVKLRDDMQKYKESFVTDEFREIVRKKNEERELAKRKQDEERYAELRREAEKERELEHQAGAELDDLFKSMNKR